MRRRVGHVGALATVAMLSILVGTRAPRMQRFLVAIPAATAASGYLQARSRFCARFGMLGVYNFGPLHGTLDVAADPRDHALDVAAARRIGLQAAGIALAVGAAAAALPLS